VLLPNSSEPSSILPLLFLSKTSKPSSLPTQPLYKANPDDVKAGALLILKDNAGTQSLSDYLKEHTDVIDGEACFISTLRIGDNIGSQTTTGTLGGFVMYRDIFPCFLTCAHLPIILQHN
jgi:hypothetical protein